MPMSIQVHVCVHACDAELRNQSSYTGSHIVEKFLLFLSPLGPWPPCNLKDYVFGVKREGAVVMAFV